MNRFQALALLGVFSIGLTIAPIETTNAQTQSTGLPLPRFVSLRAAEEIYLPVPVYQNLAE